MPSRYTPAFTLSIALPFAKLQGENPPRAIPLPIPPWGQWARSCDRTLKPLRLPQPLWAPSRTPLKGCKSGAVPVPGKHRWTPWLPAARGSAVPSRSVPIPADPSRSEPCRARPAAAASPGRAPGTAGPAALRQPPGSRPAPPRPARPLRGPRGGDRRAEGAGRWRPLGAPGPLRVYMGLSPPTPGMPPAGGLPARGVGEVMCLTAVLPSLGVRGANRPPHALCPLRTSGSKWI